MKLIHCYLFICWILLVHERVVESITCYTCDACGKDKNSWGSATILADNAACFKYAYHEKPISYANRGVRSSCSPGPDGIGGTTYCCSTNYCNGSISLSTSIGLILFINLLKRILFY